MKKKINMSKTVDFIGEEQECTDIVIIHGEVYPENQIPLELENEKDLPDVIDEDMLYEKYRDRELFDTKIGGPKQRHN